MATLSYTTSGDMIIAGADISFINHFKKHFGVTAKVELDLTFRMPDRLTDLASGFVQRNPAQSRRRLGATNKAAEPTVHLHWHAPTKIAEHGGGSSGNERDDRKCEGLPPVLDMIAAEADDRVEVLILGRYKHQKPRDLGKLQRAYPNLALSFSTVHAAKGLEADVVIVLDVSAGRFGFPSGVTDDPILSLVLADADPFPHAEERRLFYVALTRAKRSVHLIVPRFAPSPFVDEIVKAGLIVHPPGDAEHVVERCLQCGGPMQIRQAKSAFLGCRNFPLCRGTRSSRNAPKGERSNKPSRAVEVLHLG